MDKTISMIKMVITYNGAEEGSDQKWTSGAGNDLFLNLGGVYKGVALQLSSNCMCYALFTFLSVVSELKGYPSHFFISCDLALTISCTLMMNLNIYCYIFLNE